MSNWVGLPPVAMTNLAAVMVDAFPLLSNTSIVFGPMNFPYTIINQSINAEINGLDWIPFSLYIK